MEYPDDIAAPKIAYEVYKRLSFQLAGAETSYEGEILRRGDAVRRCDSGEAIIADQAVRVPKRTSFDLAVKLICGDILEKNPRDWEFFVGKCIATNDYFDFIYGIARRDKGETEEKKSMANNDETPNLDYLKERARRLNALFEDPQPGLFRWVESVGVVLKEISDFYREKSTFPSCDFKSSDFERALQQWNFKADKDGVLFCNGTHEKSLGCNYVMLSPAGCVRLIEGFRDEVLSFHRKFCEISKIIGGK